ncbi:MAG: metal-sulfur cluster assembly factor [Streptosporangiaceae bacterium]
MAEQVAGGLGRAEGGGASGGPLAVASWLAGEADPRVVVDMLYEVIDPELGVNIVDLGLVYDVRVTGGVARVRMTMTTPGCPLGAYFDDAIPGVLWGVPGVDDVDLGIVWDPPWSPGMMSDAAKRALGWRR